jgi:hypothetical protein
MTAMSSAAPTLIPGEEKSKRKKLENAAFGKGGIEAATRRKKGQPRCQRKTHRTPKLLSNLPMRNRNSVEFGHLLLCNKTSLHPRSSELKPAVFMRAILLLLNYYGYTTTAETLQLSIWCSVTVPFPGDSWHESRAKLRWKTCDGIKKK